MVHPQHEHYHQSQTLSRSRRLMPRSTCQTVRCRTYVPWLLPAGSTRVQPKARCHRQYLPVQGFGALLTTELSCCTSAVVMLLMGTVLHPTALSEKTPQVHQLPAVSPPQKHFRYWATPNEIRNRAATYEELVQGDVISRTPLVDPSALQIAA
jgi:hypothetical protein